MAKTTAERQAAYRERQFSGGVGGNGQRRVNMWLGTEAALALGRLSSRYGERSMNLSRTCYLPKMSASSQR